MKYTRVEYEKRFLLHKGLEKRGRILLKDLPGPVSPAGKASLVLCEIEADGLEELLSIRHTRATKSRKIPFFTGGSLCRTSRADLLRKFPRSREILVLD